MLVNVANTVPLHSRCWLEALTREHQGILSPLMGNYRGSASQCYNNLMTEKYAAYHNHTWQNQVVTFALCLRSATSLSR